MFRDDVQAKRTRVKYIFPSKNTREIIRKE
jgi:hypothetical protein